MHLPGMELNAGRVPAQFSWRPFEGSSVTSASRRRKPRLGALLVVKVKTRQNERSLETKCLCKMRATLRRELGDGLV